MKDEATSAVIGYGQTLMARVAGGKPAKDPPWVASFLALLTGSADGPVPAAPLRSILTLVDLAGETAAPGYLLPVAVSTEPVDEVWGQKLSDPAGERAEGGQETAVNRGWRLNPVGLATAAAASRQPLYAEFIQAGGEGERSFQRFFHLMRKYASTLPNTYGEAGVSLFEQWKMVAALVQISDSTDKTPKALGLVGGDIPGIQRTINLVTSKGAAKAMRGRSAFIQLLGFALVQRLLSELDLCEANVVYDAGGNFVLLTGWNEDLPRQVADVSMAVNEVLLAGVGQGKARFDGFHGDLAVALGVAPLPIGALSAADQVVDASGKIESLWQQHEKLVKDAVARAKERPFGDLAQASDDGWRQLFEPEPSETDEFCAVCRRQRRKDERFVPLDADAPEDISVRATQQCPECDGFKQLAEGLGRGAHLMIDEQEPAEVAGWQRALHVVSGRWYSIGDDKSMGDVSLALDLDGFPKERVDGFKLLAHTTPRTGKIIKPNDVLAEASQGGTKRLGVLRMDVDDLGNLVVHGLPVRSPMATAELSAVLERFFAGWLDRICQRVDERQDLFYVLFAGGDDLLVLGPWSYMPLLALEIRDDFAQYTGRHPAIHLSAGIAVVGGKAPLYAAADEAHEALAAAKHLDSGMPQAKNAISFLGRPYHWNDFEVVVDLQQRIAGLVEEQGLPTSLITRLQAIERRFQEDAEKGRGRKGERKSKSGETLQILYGPWMWRQAYAIARLAGAYSQAGEQLYELETDLLDGKIEKLGVAARWAQWLTRKE